MKLSVFGRAIFCVLAISALFIFSTGCVRVARRLTKSRNYNSTPAPAESERIFDNADTLTSFTTELKRATGSENPEVVNIYIYDSHISAEVRNDSQSGNTDRYMFSKGTISDPKPGRTLTGSYTNNIFSLNDVNWSAFPALTSEINEKLQTIEGSKLTGYTVTRQSPRSNIIVIYPVINANGRVVKAKADANGNLTEFKTN